MKMNKKVNDFILDIFENLTCFSKKNDDFNDYRQELKEWWQNYSMCMLFCLFCGIIVVGLSLGLLLAEKKIDERFFNGELFNPRPSGINNNSEHIENFSVMRKECPTATSIVTANAPKVKE